MKKILLLTLAVASLAGCHQSDRARVERKTIDGVECIVTRDGFGRIRRTDCSWGHR